MSTKVFEVGDSVICDRCNEDWTNRVESGGFLFESKAYCPVCAVHSIETIRKYGEERFIHDWCPPDLSFADWVRRLRYRTGDDKIIIHTG